MGVVGAPASAARETRRRTSRRSDDGRLGGEPGHGSPIGGTREPRGRFLTLQPAQDGFKPLEIAVTHGFVTMFSGWLLMSPHVRMNCVMRSKMGFIGTDSVPLDMLAQASWRANRRTRVGPLALSGAACLAFALKPSFSCEPSFCAFVAVVLGTARAALGVRRGDCRSPQPTRQDSCG